MIRSFLIRFLPVAALIAVILFLFYRAEAGNLKAVIEADSSAAVDHQELGISNAFRQVVSDLMILSSQGRLLEMLESNRPDVREALAADYLVYSAKKGIYDQVRFLDEKGMEVVRVSFNRGHPAVVPADQLQPKGNRYYFKDTFELEKGDVFISPFDLNVEHGEIEQPLKPMIRFGTPVFDGAGQKRGIVVLNYLGADLLRNLEARHQQYGQLMLQNADGFWLKGPAPEDEWGFMYEDRGNLTFGSRFPEAWQAIRGAKSGQLENDDGLFTFQAIFPRAEGQRPGGGTGRTSESSAQGVQADGYSWTVVSHVTADALGVEMRPIRVRFILLFAGLTTLLASGSLVVILVELGRKQARMALQASTEEKAVIDEMARIVTATLDLDQVYEKFVDQMKKLVDFDRFAVSIVDHDAGTFTPKYRSGVRFEGREHDTNVPLEGSKAGWVLRMRRPLLRQDILLGDRFPVDEARLQVGIRSDIMVPLFSKGVIVGLLSVFSCRVAAYGPREQAILERLADQIAPALENAGLHDSLQKAYDELESRVEARTAENSQLYQELQASTEELAVIDEVARIVTSTLDIDQVYEEFAAEVKKLVDFDRMTINVMDEEAGIQTSTYQAGAHLAGHQINSPMPLEGTMVERVFRTGLPLVREHISRGESFPGDSARLEAGLYSNITVPLFSKGRIVSTMALHSRRASAYGLQEQAILERLADQIAPAVENARLYEELQEAHRELESRVEARTAELKGAEEKPVQAQKMEVVGRLAGGIAHDFNNLLTPITGYSVLGVDELTPDHPVQGYLQQVLRSAERGAELVRQLLGFARRQVVQPRVLNLNDHVINTEKMLRRLIGEDVELVCRLEPELGLVKVDAGQIEQVLVNLSVNARDAMPNGGKLTIATVNVDLDSGSTSESLELVSGPYVMISVYDTGAGIDEEVKSHMFEPFFTTKGVGEGTGLGLATCYGIVKQSGGEIRVQSAVGQGTTFEIYLPRVEEAAPASAEGRPPMGMPRGMETVLLVEDEPAVRSLASLALRRQGYTVLEAADGQEALLVAQERGGNAIDLLLTDVVMPRMGGREVADRLHPLMPQMKVLLTSGFPDQTPAPDEEWDPGTAFMPKPFTPMVLAQKVREVLDTPSPGAWH